MDAVDIVNAIAFVAFVGLAVMAVARMALRIVLYYTQGKRPSVVLRRDFALLVGLLFVFGAPVVIQFFGWGHLYFEGGALRLPYTIVRNIIGVGSLAYWVYVEYFVIGQDGKEDA
jgi:hypothetical protein